MSLSFTQRDGTIIGLSSTFDSPFAYLTKGEGNASELPVKDAKGMCRKTMELKISRVKTRIKLPTTNPEDP